MVANGIWNSIFNIGSLNRAETYIILLKHYINIMVTVHKLQTAKKDERRSNWKEKLVIMEKNNALW